MERDNYLEETYQGFCKGCVHHGKKSPSPCDSCSQEIPTNFTEEDGNEKGIY